MLMPRKVAHRKHHRGRTKGNAKGGTELHFGDYGIQALEPGWITARQIEAARIAMTRTSSVAARSGSTCSRTSPSPKKPAETRMGSGKGNPELWVAVVRPGRVLFELSYHDEEIARAAIDRAIQKLPIKARSSRVRRVLTWRRQRSWPSSRRRTRRRARRRTRGAVQPALPATPPASSRTPPNRQGPQDRSRS